MISFARVVGIALFLVLLINAIQPDEEWTSTRMIYDFYASLLSFWVASIIDDHWTKMENKP